MKITLQLEVSDSVITQEAGEYESFVRDGLSEEILCYTINQLDMDLDEIIRNMINGKQEEENARNLHDHV